MFTVTKKTCNTCGKDKFFAEYTYHTRSATYSNRCRACVKIAKDANPDENTKIRRNSAKSTLYISRHFSKPHKAFNENFGRAADGTCFCF